MSRNYQIKISEKAINKLFITNIEIANKIWDSFSNNSYHISQDSFDLLIDDILWSLSQEISFGIAVSEGYIELIKNKDQALVVSYHEQIKKSGADGPTFGKIIALFLNPVLLTYNKEIFHIFLDAVYVMKNKGTYTLENPLKTLSTLLKLKDYQSALIYLKLLKYIFSQDISYNQCQHFSYFIPKTVLSFSDSKRIWQIQHLFRLAKIDIKLLEPFIDGINKGLNLLDIKGLSSFIDTSLKKYETNFKSCINFLSLESKLGIDTYLNLQVEIPLSHVQEKLNRYLNARTNLNLSVKSISYVSELINKSEIRVCSDGKFIYLPEEINRYPNKKDNENLYKCLTSLEAGLYEFGTFYFDIEKIKDQINSDKKNDKSDLEYFFSSFTRSGLVSDLFTICEHTRINLIFLNIYPGIIKKSLPYIKDEIFRIYKNNKSENLLFFIYTILILGEFPIKYCDFYEKNIEIIQSVVKYIKDELYKSLNVETCAKIVIKLLKKFENTEEIVSFPFGRKIYPNLFFNAYKQFENQAKNIKNMLEKYGLHVYQSEIKKQLIENKGNFSNKHIKGLLKSYNQINEEINDSSKSIFCYKEWDFNSNDYLYNYVRVQDKILDGIDTIFYQKTIKEYSALISKIRYVFELMKPKELSILRQWVEGDEFDYRALIDYVIDKKAKVITSDKIYLKRIKNERSIAVLLLVDLSKSTSNIVAGSSKIVLEVEKEAIILFCEALEIIGDSFSIAGFSGTGRLSVDYFRIKDFNEQLNNTVKQRICAISPQRSTRMGAAIRHASYLLEKIDSKKRLLIILGDGFPNDVDYKKEYAVCDTRKAILEAISKNIFVKAITINISYDLKFDNIYGNVHHNIITDIQELPNKLLKIYSSLTK